MLSIAVAVSLVTLVTLVGMLNQAKFKNKINKILDIFVVFIIEDIISQSTEILYHHSLHLDLLERYIEVS